MELSLSSGENLILILVEWQSWLAPFGCYVLAHDELLDLAARSTREFVGPVQFLGPLLPRHPGTLEVGADLVERRHHRTRPEPEHRRRTLSQPRIGGGHHHR